MASLLAGLTFRLPFGRPRFGMDDSTRTALCASGADTSRARELFAFGLPRRLPRGPLVGVSSERFRECDDSRPELRR